MLLSWKWNVMDGSGARKLLKYVRRSDA